MNRLVIIVGCLLAATGNEKREFKSRMPIACTPAVDGGVV